MSEIDHELKIAYKWFKLVKTLEKKAEIRNNDRNFKVGDTVVLNCYADGEPTGESITVKITNIITHEQFPDGIKEGYCVFSFIPDGK